MSGAFGLAGWHFSSNPTSSSSENKIGKAEGTEPWKTGGNAAYQYHPHGDTSKPRKDAPSALNEVIIPNVNLPKVSEIGGLERHKELQSIASRTGEIWPWNDQDKVLTNVYSRFTRSTTSGARRVSRRFMRVSESCVNIKSFEGRIERFPCVHHRNFPHLSSWTSTSQLHFSCGFRLSIDIIQPDSVRRRKCANTACLLMPIHPRRDNRPNQQSPHITVQYYSYASSESSIADRSNSRLAVSSSCSSTFFGAMCVAAMVDASLGRLKYSNKRHRWLSMAEDGTGALKTRSKELLLVRVSPGSTLKYMYRPTWSSGSDTYNESSDQCCVNAMGERNRLNTLFSTTFMIALLNRIWTIVNPRRGAYGLLVNDRRPANDH
jgi:hypothetical protein